MRALHATKSSVEDGTAMDRGVVVERTMAFR